MILDVRLPESEDGGFMLAREARSAGYKGPILFMTARDALADRIGHWQVLLFSSSAAALVLPPCGWQGGQGNYKPSGSRRFAMPWPGGGIGTALTNVALQSASPEKRNLYLAWYWMAFAVGGILGSLLGGALGSLHQQLKLFPSPYHLPILVSMLLRVVAVYYLWWRIRRDKKRAAALRAQA